MHLERKTKEESNLSFNIWKQIQQRERKRKRANAEGETAVETQCEENAKQATSCSDERLWVSQLSSGSGMALVNTGQSWLIQWDERLWLCQTMKGQKGVQMMVDRWDVSSEHHWRQMFLLSYSSYSLSFSRLFPSLYLPVTRVPYCCFLFCMLVLISLNSITVLLIIVSTPTEFVFL